MNGKKLHHLYSHRPFRLVLVLAFILGSTGLGERTLFAGSGGVGDSVARATASADCPLVSNEKISCNTNGTFAYTLTVTNTSTVGVSELAFFPLTTTFTVNPNIISLNTPLAPGASMTQTLTVSGPGAVSGATVCSTFGLAVPAGGFACTATHCITLPGCCTTAPSGMVAWWPLDESPLDTVIADIAGNNNGTMTPNFPHSFPGKVGNALGFCSAPFTSAPILVTVPDNATLNFGTGGSFSIDAWINPAGFFPMIVDKLNAPAPSGGYRFYVAFSNNASRLKLDIGTGQFTGTTALTSGHALSPDNWNHVAVTVDRAAGVVTFYVNGQAEVVGGSTTLFNASSPGLDLLIGGTHDPQFSACEYGLDEVEIFNRALAPGDIRAISDAGSAGKCRCVTPPSGMVSWWPANGNPNDIADSNQGVLQGNATFAPGKVGQAFSFAAQGDYVEVPSAANLNFGPAGSGGDLSIDAWIRTTSLASNQPIVDKRDLPGGAFGSQSIGYTLFLFNGKLAFALGDGTFFNYISPGPDLRDGVFHHVAVTVDRTSSTGGRLYVGGIVVLTFDPTNRPASLTNNKPLFIGRHAGDPTVAFIGLIDEVEIFNRALSEGDIHGIINAGPEGKCRPRRRRPIRH